MSKLPTRLAGGTRLLLLGGLDLTLAILTCGCDTSGSSSNGGGSIGPPKMKLITYETKFRVDYGRVIHLAMVLYFRGEGGTVSPYGARYTLVHKATGQRLEGSVEYLNINPCEFGYTGVEQILDAPPGYGYYAELTLKSKQGQKPGRVGEYPIQEGSWWITKGKEFPYFSARDYRVQEVLVFDNKTGATQWRIVPSQL